MSSAREVALLILSACERQGAWSDGRLKREIRQAGLDKRDAALASRLCFGVLQNRLLLDYYIDQFSYGKVRKMETHVRNALRLGLYQMAFLTRIPHRAAVNESVELTRKYCKNPRAPGMVNGILRNFSRKIDQLPPLEQSDPIAGLSLRYSHPEWIVREFAQVLGLEGTEQLLRAHNGEIPITAQVNTCKSDIETALACLEKDGVTAQPHPWLADCIEMSATGDIEELTTFQEGKIYIQDAAARLAVTALKLTPGMKLLDACAAPGGKSFAAAIAMGDQGKILACDSYGHKKKLIEAGAQRLGLQCIQAAVMDATVHNQSLDGGFDGVLADVPCSGLGVIRKKPEIRYKDPADLAALPALQGAILNNVSSYVRPGGVLLYATCTLRKQENEDVVEAFLARHPDFSPESFVLPGPAGEVKTGMVTLWPHIHGTDGFFIAKLRRMA